MAIIKWIGITLISVFCILVLLIILIDWNWARDFVTRQVSEETGRTFTIDGDITVDWSLAPQIRIEKIQLENAAWSNHPYMLDLAALELQIDLTELITGRVVFPRIALNKPQILLEKSPEGKSNWEFKTDAPSDEIERTDFPIIQRLLIADGRVVYRDLMTDTKITAALTTIQGQGGGGETVELKAQGKLEGQPLKIILNADPFSKLQEAESPYFINLAAQTGGATIKFDGALLEPLALKGVDAQIAMTVPAPARLSPFLTMIGVPMPSLPPYQLKGNLLRKGAAWQLIDFDGRVGDSDLTGDFLLDTGGARPFIKANLTSRILDFDDLGPLIGVTPDTGAGETASPSQEQEAEQEDESPFVLPKDHIDFEKLQLADADITFRGKRIESKLPLDDLNMQINVDNGDLTLAPLNFGLAMGNVKSHIEFHAKKQPVKSKIEVEIKHVRLSEILHRFEIADESAGLIGGRGLFWFEGNSVAQMLASADGGLLMLMTGGQFDSLLTELGGLDVGETLVTLIGDQEDIDINCVFVDLPTKKGIMNMDTLVVDTDDTIFLGKGSIDFTQEQLDLVIDPKPKDLSLFSARAPLDITGSFKEPAFSPKESALIRGAVSLALLPSAPIVGLIGLLQEEDNETKEENIHCSGLVNAINEAR